MTSCRRRSASCWRGACRATASSRHAGAGTRSSARSSAPSAACASTPRSPHRVSAVLLAEPELGALRRRPRPPRGRALVAAARRRRGRRRGRRRLHSVAARPGAAGTDGAHRGGAATGRCACGQRREYQHCRRARQLRDAARARHAARWWCRAPSSPTTSWRTACFPRPVARRNLLSAFMTSDPAAAGTEEPPEDAKMDVKVDAH